MRLSAIFFPPLPAALGAGSSRQLLEASRMLGKDVLSYILKHQLYGTTFSEPESIGLENE
jgi:hypothetical protein